MGLMGEVVNEMFQYGGEVIGIMFCGLFSGEIVYIVLIEFIEVESMYV